MKKTILFVAALKQEMDIIKKELQKIDSKKIGFKFLLTWTWNYNAIYELSNYVKEKKIDYIVNIGVCGQKKEYSENFFQVYRIKDLSCEKESLLPVYFTFWNLESIASSNTIVTNQKQLWDEMFVDMESFWIDFVATKEKIPTMILKIPFDIIWDKSKGVSLDSLRQKMEAFPYSELVSNLEAFFEKNPDEYDFTKIKKHFNLTFSETEILKKNFYRIEALGWDFEKLYKKNKNLSKKEFISLLGTITNNSIYE